MSLKTTLQEDMKSAMKSGDSNAVGVLRMMISAIKNKEIEKKTDTLPDEEISQLLLAEAKKRKDSVDAFTKGGRQDLADKEKKELDIMQKYLPKQMGREEVEKIVESIVKKSGPKEIGPLMKAVMAELRGKADSGMISEIVKQKLSS